MFPIEKILNKIAKNIFFLKTIFYNTGIMVFLKNSSVFQTIDFLKKLSQNARFERIICVQKLIF